MQMIMQMIMQTIMQATTLVLVNHKVTPDEVEYNSTIPALG